MKVSEVARQAGIAPSAVRFYEEIGVLPGARRAKNGYREYAPSDVSRLRLVVALRRLGLAPADAGRLAAACISGGTVDPALTPLLDEQRAAIARRRVELDRLEAELGDLEETVVAASRGDGSAPATPIRVLFVCSGNSARSQIAEALLRAVGGDAFEPFSAGTEPRPIDPLTIQALAEIGIDWSAARSKSVGEFVEAPFDYVVTVCDRARTLCPVFPGEHNTLHWGLEDPAEVRDPAEERSAAFRATIAEVSVRIRPFVELARASRTGSRAPVRA